MLPALPSTPPTDSSNKAPPVSCQGSIKSVHHQAMEEIRNNAIPSEAVEDRPAPRLGTSKLPPLSQSIRSRSDSPISEEPSLDYPVPLSLRRPPLKTFRSRTAFADGRQSPSSPTRQESFNIPLHRLGAYDQNAKGRRPQSPSDSPVHHPSMKNLLKTSLSPKQSMHNVFGTVDAEAVAICMVPSTDILDPHVSRVDILREKRPFLPSRALMLELKGAGASTSSSSLTDEELASSSFSSGSKASTEYDIFADFSSFSIRSITE